MLFASLLRLFDSWRQMQLQCVWRFDHWNSFNRLNALKEMQELFWQRLRNFKLFSRFIFQLSSLGLSCPVLPFLCCSLLSGRVNTSHSVIPGSSHEELRSLYAALCPCDGGSEKGFYSSLFTHPPSCRVAMATAGLAWNEPGGGFWWGLGGENRASVKERKYGRERERNGDLKKEGT